MVGIALHSIIPVRTEAREEAEQSTQMLFGEVCTVLEQTGRWARVRLESDGQEGWVDAKMCTPMTERENETYRAALKRAAVVAFPMAYAVSENNGQTIPLTAGTWLADYRGGRFEILGVGFKIDPAMVFAEPQELTETSLQQVVRFFLNTPYLWGGKNALGMDCSGFTQVIMSLFGKQLLRNASEQATQGAPVEDLAHAQAGDLVFFDHSDGKISHVGVILQRPTTNDQQPTTTLIHCSGRVKVERLEPTGILSFEQTDGTHPQGQYTHHLVMIRRV